MPNYEETMIKIFDKWLKDLNYIEDMKMMEVVLRNLFSRQKGILNNVRAYRDEDGDPYYEIGYYLDSKLIYLVAIIDYDYDKARYVAQSVELFNI